MKGDDADARSKKRGSLDDVDGGVRPNTERNDLKTDTDTHSSSSDAVDANSGLDEDQRGAAGPENAGPDPDAGGAKTAGATDGAAKTADALDGAATRARAPDAQASTPTRPIFSSRVIGALGAGLALLFALTPWPLDAKLRLVGQACCAQSTTRTLSIGGQLMPLDARDAGIYLSFLFCLLWTVLVRRSRCALLPPWPLTALLLGLLGAMVLDGFNSSAQSHGLHGLYESSNVLRVVTGAGAGLALVLLVLPLANQVVRREPELEAIVDDYLDLVVYVILAVIVVSLLLASRAWLYYPLSVLASAGVVIGWSGPNALVVAVATRREHKVVTRGDTARLLLAGMVLALLEMGVIDLVRHSTGGA